MIQVLHNIKPVDATDLCYNLTEVWPIRETGSGLWRTDLDLRTEFIVLDLREGLASALRQSIHSMWAMQHSPGSPAVFMHSHNNWATGIWYPVSHPTPLELGEFGDYTPVGGDLVILPPGTMHGVAPNNTDEIRYSVPVLFEWHG